MTDEKIGIIWTAAERESERYTRTPSLPKQRIAMNGRSLDSSIEAKEAPELFTCKLQFATRPSFPWVAAANRLMELPARRPICRAKLPRSFHDAIVSLLPDSHESYSHCFTGLGL